MKTGGFLETIGFKEFMVEKDLHWVIERMKSRNPELEKKLQLNRWLGAIFEVEGSLYFSRESKTTGTRSMPRAWPVVQISSDNILFLEELRHVLDLDHKNFTKSKRDKSMTLSLYRKDAVSLAERVKSFAPSRKLIIDHMLWWGEGVGRGDEYEAAIAYEERRKRKSSEVEIEEYLQLLDNPAFVAGLIDARGNYHDRMVTQKSRYTGEPHTTRRIWLSIHSNRVNLLKALHKKFHGTNLQHATRTLFWKAEGEYLQQLLEYAQPFLHLELMPGSSTENPPDEPINI